MAEEINWGASRVDRPTLFYYPTLFYQPAVHLEPNAAWGEAARRKTREEYGWDVTLTGCVRLNLICGRRGVGA